MVCILLTQGRRSDALVVGWFPLSIWSWPDHKLVKVVIASFETELADLNFVAVEALVLWLIDDRPFAAAALE